MAHQGTGVFPWPQVPEPALALSCAPRVLPPSTVGSLRSWPSLCSSGHKREQGSSLRLFFPGSFMVRKYYILGVSLSSLPALLTPLSPPHPTPAHTKTKHNGFMILMFLFRQTEAQETCLAGSSSVESLEPKSLPTALY